jgi:hypothetical protein
MTPLYVKASRIVDARPETIYAILRDYRVGHLAILPKPYFASMTVESGGQGAGTVVNVEMQVMGVERCFRLIVTEPEPGRILQEEDSEADIITTFTVEPVGDGSQSMVTIASVAATQTGFTGMMERLLNPLITRHIYNQELENLALVVQQQRVAAR